MAKLDANDVARERGSVGLAAELDAKQGAAPVVGGRKHTRKKLLAGFRQALDDTYSGRNATVPWPWRYLNQTESLCPGDVTVVAGLPGHTKSLIIQEAILSWLIGGIDCRVLFYEKDRNFYLRRALAQLGENGRLTSREHLRRHQADAEAALQANEDRLGDFAERISDIHDIEPTLDAMLGWIQKQCAAGVRIIVVDPVTAADAGDKPWNSERRFLADARKALDKSGTTLVLVTHNRGGAPRRLQDLTIDDIAGARAQGRFIDSCFWIYTHGDEQESEVIQSVGRCTVTHDRTIRLIKVRDGNWQGRSLAYSLDGEKLRFVEHGVIV